MHAKNTCSNFRNGLLMIVDPEIMHLNTLFVQLCAILAKMYKTIDFTIMVALIMHTNMSQNRGHSNNNVVLIADP